MAEQPIQFDVMSFNNNIVYTYKTGLTKSIDSQPMANRTLFILEVTNPGIESEELPISEP